MTTPIDLHDPMLLAAQRLTHHTRRSLIARVTLFSLALTSGVATARRAVAVAAPSAVRFKLHCYVGGVQQGHTGGTCPDPSRCPSGTVAGGCWYSCCQHCFGSYAQFCDCCYNDNCDPGTNYCPTSHKCFSCKTDMCTALTC